MGSNSNFPNAKKLVQQQIQTALENAGLKKVDVDLDNSSFQLLTIDYATLQSKGSRPDVLQSSTYENSLNTTTSEQFTVDKTTTDTIGWTVTAGLELDEEFNVGLPFFGGSKTTVKLNFGVSTTQTSSIAHKWNYSTTVPVEGHSTVIVTFEVDEDQVDTTFTATFLASADLKVTYKDQKGHDQKFKGTIAQLIEGTQVSGVTLPQSTFQVQAKGSFSGTEAQAFHVSAKNPAGAVRQLASGPSSGVSKVLVAA
ncbi:hypothetical protein [Corallococcus interemptor]|uniref:hypothetical protein n=1 Tax=Corallococcus interemptor TaxID=2316720 RepID=UPI001ABF63F1|nr:hypothetical protein [Corallococcus interemptor]